MARSLYNSIAQEMNSAEIRNYKGPVTLESLDAECIALENRLEKLLSAGSRLDGMANSYTEVSIESLQNDMTYVRSIVMLNKEYVSEEVYSGLDTISISKEDRPSVVYSKIQLARENFIVDAVKKVFDAIITVIKKIIDFITGLFSSKVSNNAAIAKQTKPETLKNIDPNALVTPELAKTIAGNIETLSNFSELVNSGIEEDNKVRKTLLEIIENREIPDNHYRNFMYLALCSVTNNSNLENEIRIGNTIKLVKQEVERIVNIYSKNGTYDLVKSKVLESIAPNNTSVFPFKCNGNNDEEEDVSVICRPIMLNDEDQDINFDALLLDLKEPLGGIRRENIPYVSLKIMKQDKVLHDFLKRIARQGPGIHRTLQNSQNEIPACKTMMNECSKLISKFQEAVFKNEKGEHNNQYECMKVVKYVRGLIMHYCPIALSRSEKFGQALKTVYAYALSCAATNDKNTASNLVVSKEDASIPKVTYDNVTKFAISSPNVIMATNLVVKEVENVKSDDASLPLAVQAAPTVIEKVTKKLETIQENPMEYIDTVEGKEWLQSPEGQRVIKAAVEEVKEERDMISFEIMPDVSKENSVATKAYAAEVSEDSSDEEKEAAYEATMIEASDNADKISRLENIEDIIATGYDAVDNAVSIESAVVYSKMMDLLRLELKDKLDITQEEYKISKEEFAYDPRGALFVSQEGLGDFFIKIYDMIKNLIAKFIKWIKGLFSKSKLVGSMISSRCDILLKTLSNKKELTRDQFNNVEIMILNKYKALAHIGDYTLSGMLDYAHTAHKLRKVIDKPIKDSYSIVNKLKNDLDSNNGSVDQEVQDLEKIFSKENIIDNLFKFNRNDRLNKLDDAVNEGLPVYVIGNVVHVATNNGLKYDIVKKKDISLNGKFDKQPNNADIKRVISSLKISNTLINHTIKDIEATVSYTKRFMDIFKGYKSKHHPNGSVTNVIDALTSYARVITTRFDTLELASITTNSNIMYKICKELVNACEDR